MYLVVLLQAFKLTCCKKAVEVICSSCNCQKKHPLHESYFKSFGEHDFIINFPFEGAKNGSVVTSRNDLTLSSYHISTEMESP